MLQVNKYACVWIGERERELSRCRLFSSFPWSCLSDTANPQSHCGISAFLHISAAHLTLAFPRSTHTHTHTSNTISVGLNPPTWARSTFSHHPNTQTYTLPRVDLQSDMNLLELRGCEWIRHHNHINFPTPPLLVLAPVSFAFPSLFYIL